MNIADEDEISKVPLAAMSRDDAEDSPEEKEKNVGIQEDKIGRKRLESEREVSEEVQPSMAQDASMADDAMLHDISEEEEITETTREDLMCRRYKVWRPNRKPHLPDLVRGSKESRQKKSVPAVPPLDHSTSTISLLIRQQQLLDRVQATQAVLKESHDEILSPSLTPKKPRMSFKEASQHIISHQKRQSRGHSSLSDIVTQYQMKLKKERETSQVPGTPKSPISLKFPPLRSKPGLTKQPSILGAIPIDKWHELKAENEASLKDISDGNDK